MGNEMDRRGFLKGSVAASAGMAFGVSREEEILLRQLAQNTNSPAPTGGPALKAALPKGRIRDLEVSRLICGGNLIGGWAHSRDLIYVSRLFKAYNTDEKIMDTLELCEQNGINAIITNPVSGDVINRYKRERGGTIQWIVEGHPTEKDMTTDIQKSIDNGAAAVYIQGAIGDRWIRQGRMDLVQQTVAFVRENGLPAGVGAHQLAVPVACEKDGVDPDFYVKTLHRGDYWSAQRPDQNKDVVDNLADNYWSMTPEETIAFMATVDKPWIAFKVLAAGAIPPRKGFEYAFKGGADFICVGMFDFHVAEDAAIANEILASLERERPWRA